jgi:hypothetical protein
MPNTMSTANFKPAQHDIELVKGNSWQETYVFTLDNVAINLSTATVLVSIYQGCSTSAALLTATNGNGITISGVGNNTVTINKIVDLSAGNYIWDMKITFTDGTVRTYVWGDFILYLNINQP